MVDVDTRKEYCKRVECNKVNDCHVGCEKSRAFLSGIDYAEKELNDYKKMYELEKSKLEILQVRYNALKEFLEEQKK